MCVCVCVCVDIESTTIGDYHWSDDYRGEKRQSLCVYANLT